MHPKIKHWFSRYALADAVALLAVFAGGMVASPLGGFLAAHIATWMENTAYYSTLLIRDRKQHESFLKQLWAMLLEFGPAEFFDTVISRPFLLWYFAQTLGPAGFLAGKLAADLLFYTIAILSYEQIRRKA